MLFYIWGWNDGRRRVSQRLLVKMLMVIRMKKLKLQPWKKTPQKQNLTPSPSPPPNWACVVPSARHPAAAEVLWSPSEGPRSLWLLPWQQMRLFLLFVAQNRRKSHSADGIQDLKWFPPFPLLFSFFSIRSILLVWLKHICRAFLYLRVSSNFYAMLLYNMKKSGVSLRSWLPPRQPSWWRPLNNSDRATLCRSHSAFLSLLRFSFLPCLFSASLGSILVGRFKTRLGKKCAKAKAESVCQERKWSWNVFLFPAASFPQRPELVFQFSVWPFHSSKILQSKVLLFIFYTFGVFLWSWSECSERSIGCDGAGIHWCSQNRRVLLSQRLFFHELVRDGLLFLG